MMRQATPRNPLLDRARALAERLALVDVARMPTALKAAAPHAPELVHLLSRTSFGISRGELEIAQLLGYDGYLDYQLDYQAIDDAWLEDVLAELFPSLAMSYQEIFQAVESDQEFNPAPELIVATMARQLFSPRQLFEVMTEFWTNHFNVFIFDGPVQYLKTGDDRDNIRPHALGRFRDLLYANARSPAMLIYLDNFSNTKFGPNENYARELMELHTLGVDGGYTETDVKEVARCFTGWTIDPRTEQLFAFNPLEHDTGEKTVLGQTIPAGQGIEDGEQVLEILLAHPSTARFLATKLARRFIADDPPASVIDEVADAYAASDGDVRFMLEVLLGSDEFLAASEQKFKRPAEFVGSVVRTLEPVSEGDYFGVVFRQLEGLGQIPFFEEEPTGYGDTIDHWLNSNALLGRWNLGFGVAFGDVPVGSRAAFDDREPDAERVMADFIQLPIFELLDEARTPAEIVDRLVERVLYRPLTRDERDTLIEHAAAGRPGSAPLELGDAVSAARSALAALLASHHFQMR